MTARILLAEDDEIMRITLFDRLSRCGWQVTEVEDGRSALREIEKNNFELVLSDIRMPGLDGQQLLERVIEIAPETDIILMTAYGNMEDAVACMKKGAADYILKPFDMDDLSIRIRRLLAMQADKVRLAGLGESCRGQPRPIIGSGPAIRNMLKLIAQVTASDASVLITGESGTGKELVAAAIHHGSQRSKGPYIRVNCAAIPEGLIESELFGHEKGAFTGAMARKAGRFELAQDGTILLDEIGDLPLHLQAKLLRVLQEREIERVGGTGAIPIDVRVICATAKKLEDEVKNGRFREDLYYRLRVVPIEAPPLRARREDIPEICDFFLEEFSRDRGMRLTLSDAALEVLTAYDYPGNIRELRNIIERVSVLAPGPVIEPWNLPSDLTRRTGEEEDGETLELSRVLARAEKDCIRRALKRSGGSRTEAARLLGISRKNLWEKLKLHGLS